MDNTNFKLPLMRSFLAKGSPSFIFKNRRLFSSLVRGLRLLVFTPQISTLYLDIKISFHIYNDIKRDNLILLKNYILDKNLDEYKIENWLTDDTIKPNPIILDNNIENTYNDNTRLKLKKKSENRLIEKGIINEPIISKNNIKDNKENKEVENE